MPDHPEVRSLSDQPSELPSEPLAPHVRRAFAPFSDLELERYLVNDADDALRARIDEAARADPRLAAHLSERRAEKAAFALLHPRLPVLPNEDTGDRSINSLLSILSKWRLSVGAGALAAAAAVILVVLPAAPAPAPAPDPGAVAGPVRLKGAVALDVVVKRGPRAFGLRPGALLRAGDALQLAAAGAPAGFATLVVHELDTGATAVLVDNEAVASGEDGVVRLPRTIVLDEHVGPEELVLLVTPERVLAKDAVAAILEGRPPLAAGVGHVGVVRYEKEPQPR